MTAVILVIDIQKALSDPEPRPYDIEPVIQRINQLTAKGRAAHIPVFFIQHEAPDSPLAHGSDGWQLPENLERADEDHLVRKTTPDSFLHTDLEERLRALNITRLVICGYASEFCVDTTTRRAAGLGFEVDLVSDAHTTHDKPHATGAEIQAHHNATLPNISSFGVQIRALPSADITF